MTARLRRWATPETMSPSDLYWLKYPVAAFGLIGFVAVLGLPAFLVLRRRVPSWALMLAPNLGMAWAIVLVSWYARLGTSLPWWVVWGAFALVLIGLGVAAVRGDLLGTLRAGYRGPRAAAATTLGLVAPWVLGIAAVTAFLLPVISSPFQPAGYVTAYTFGNNDIGMYVTYASNIVRAGFADAGLYFAWNPGTNPSLAAASTDHAGASALLAFNAVTLGAPVWKIAEVSIMIAMAAMLTAAVALVRALLPGSPRGALAIAALGTTSFMVWYLVGNYFLAHIICLSMVLSQLAVIVLARDRLLDWRVLFTLVPLAAATWLTSPELQFVLALLVAAMIGGDFVASLVTGVPGAMRTLLTRTVAVVLSVGIAAVIILPFTSSLITRSKLVYATNGVVGWGLDLQNSVLVLFGYPDPIGSHSDLGWFAAAVLGILLLGCFAWAWVRRDRLGIGAGVFGIVLAAASAYGAQRWGWTTYQSWKLHALPLDPVPDLRGDPRAAPPQRRQPPGRARDHGRPRRHQRRDWRADVGRRAGHRSDARRTQHQRRARDSPARPEGAEAGQPQHQRPDALQHRHRADHLRQARCDVVPQLHLGRTARAASVQLLACRG